MQLIQANQDRFAQGYNEGFATVQGPATATRNDGMSIWYDPSQANDATPRLKLGSWWDDAYGNIFQYFKFNSAANIGNVLTLATPATDTVSSTGANLDTVTLVTGGLTVNAEKGNWVFFVGATAGGTSGAASLYVQALRVIKANTAAVLSVALTDPSSGKLDADVLHAAPTNATNVSIIRPFLNDTGSATAVPIGIAVSTVTAKNYAMMQKGGMALVQGIGGGTALVVNQLAAPGAAGTILGSAANSIYMGAASIIPMYAFGGAANTLIPCQINLLGV